MRLICPPGWDNVRNVPHLSPASGPSTGLWLIFRSLTPEFTLSWLCSLVLWADLLWASSYAVGTVLLIDKGSGSPPGRFYPLGNTWQGQETVWIVPVGGGEFSWHLVARGQGCLWTSSNVQDSSPVIKNYLPSDVSCAKDWETLDETSLFHFFQGPVLLLLLFLFCLFFLYKLPCNYNSEIWVCFLSFFSN